MNVGTTITSIRETHIKPDKREKIWLQFIYLLKAYISLVNRAGSPQGFIWLQKVYKIIPHHYADTSDTDRQSDQNLMKASVLNLSYPIKTSIFI